VAHVEEKEKINCGGKVCGAGLNIVEIEPDGCILYCGRYSEQFPEAVVGRADDNDFLSLKQIRRHTDFIGLKSEVLKNTGCDICIASAICEHGCMAFHYSKFKEWGIRKDLVCDSTIPIYKYMTENEFEIIKSLYDNNKDKNGEYIFKETVLFKSIKTNNITVAKLQKAGISVEVDVNNNQSLIFKSINNKVEK